MSEKYIKKIVCYGDSNTHGYNSKTMGRFNEEERWTCLLSKYLGNEYHVMEEGLEGRTTCYDDPLFEGLNGFRYLYPCIMTHKPLDLLIIMLGTNDVKQRFASTPENVAKGMERLVQKALDTKVAFRNKPRVLIIAPPPIKPGYINSFVAGEMGAGCDKKSERLAPLYKEAAERLGCYFINASEIEGVDMYPYDDMHLSLDAHKNLAKFLADYIPEIIEKE